MILEILEIPENTPKSGILFPEWVATLKRNGGSFAPDYAYRRKRINILRLDTPQHIQEINKLVGYLRFNPYR